MVVRGGGEGGSGRPQNPRHFVLGALRRVAGAPYFQMGGPLAASAPRMTWARVPGRGMPYLPQTPPLPPSSSDVLWAAPQPCGSGTPLPSPPFLHPDPPPHYRAAQSMMGRWATVASAMMQLPLPITKQHINCRAQPARHPLPSTRQPGSRVTPGSAWTKTPPPSSPPPLPPPPPGCCCCCCPTQPLTAQHPLRTQRAGRARPVARARHACHNPVAALRFGCNSSHGGCATSERATARTEWLRCFFPTIAKQQAV